MKKNKVVFYFLSAHHNDCMCCSYQFDMDIPKEQWANNYQYTVIPNRLFEYYKKALSKETHFQEIPFTLAVEERVLREGFANFLIDFNATAQKTMRQHIRNKLN